MTLAEKIKGTDDRQPVVVHIPEWDCKLNVCVMDGFKLRQWQKYCVDNKGDSFDAQAAHALLATLTCCDDEGNAVFTEEDREWLPLKSHVALSRITDVAIEINNLTKKAVEATTKNSETTATSDSG